MLNGIKNIDKFLQDLFENFRLKPNSDTWDKIADALDNTNPKDALIPNIDEVGTLLKGYKVTPSEGVWQNIFKILERDKSMVRKLSKSTVSAIVAFFSNTTVSVVTSLAVASGIVLLIFNPFKNDQSKMAALESPKQIKTYEQKAKPSIVNNPKYTTEPNASSTKLIRNQQSEINNRAEGELNKVNPKSGINNTVDYSQLTKPNINSTINTQKHTVITNKTHTNKIKSIKNQTTQNTNIDTRNQIISEDIKVSNSNGTTILIADPKSKTLINSNRMSRYPSIKMGIRQNRFTLNKANVVLIDLQKKMDALVDRFYRQWAKKFKGSREQFYFEAFYLPIYGSTTFIAQQRNSPTLSRSYNEYIIGSPSNCLGLNFGYNYKKYVFETGISYEARHTRRNDDLIWISYDTNVTIKNDSIGFIFNHSDSTYHTIYKTSVDTNINKNELKKNYRTRMTYHTVEVPILIGYKKLINKRNMLIVRTGILASFIIKSADENAYTDETVRSYIIYPERDKVDFSYILNLSYDFNINKNLKFTLTPTFRYNITGLYKGYSMNKGQATYGFGFGVKYLF